MKAAEFPTCPDLAGPALSQTGGALLFHATRKLCEKTGIIATYLDFREWSGILGDAKMTAPLQYRLTHHCPVIESGNDIHRLRRTTTKTKVSNVVKADQPGT